MHSCSGTRRQLACLSLILFLLAGGGSADFVGFLDDLFGIQTTTTTITTLPTMTTHIAPRDVISTLTIDSSMASSASSLQSKFCFGFLSRARRPTDGTAANVANFRNITFSLTAYPDSSTVSLTGYLNTSTIAAAAAAASATVTQTGDIFSDEEKAAGLGNWTSSMSVPTSSSGAAYRAMPLNFLNAVGIVGLLSGWTYLPAMFLVVVSQVHGETGCPSCLPY